MPEEFVEALKDGGVVRVTEREAREEGLVILRRPVLEKTYVPPSRHPAKSAEARENTRRSIVRDYKNNNVRDDLVQHFHWQISRARRLRNLTRYQLANVLNTTEEQIILIERGDVPWDNYVLISKIESYLGIKLRKNPPQTVPEAPIAPRPPVSRSDTQKSYPKDVTLADLQKRKELSKKLNEQDSKSLFGGDVELVE